MEIEFLKLFSCPFIKINTNPEFSLIRGNLIEFVYENKRNNPTGIIRSNNKGWHSEIYLNKEIKFESYLNFINEKITNSCNLFFNNQIKVDLLSCWANINEPGSSNDMHCHPGADMSGCLWVKSNANSGSLVFKHPFEYEFYPWITNFNSEQKSESYFSSSYYFNPVEGEMILFPSNLLHKVCENNSKEDRISLAFNLKIAEFC